MSLRLFHITGWDRREDWERYIDMWCDMLDRQPYHRLLNLGFNNLQ